MLEERWVIMANEDEGSTFSHAILDMRKDGTHRVRFGVRCLNDARLLIESLAFAETMEHGYMPAMVVEVEKKPKPRPRQRTSRKG